jgi:hypothetical protein
MSWSVWTTSPGPTGQQAPSSPAAAASDPLVCTTARGAAVVPEVNTTTAGWAGSAGASPIRCPSSERRGRAPRGTPGSHGPA